MSKALRAAIGKEEDLCLNAKRGGSPCLIMAPGPAWCVCCAASVFKCEIEIANAERDKALKAEAAATRLYVDSLHERDRLTADLWMFGRHAKGCPSPAGFGRIGVEDGARLHPGDEKTCGCRFAAAAGPDPLSGPTSRQAPARPHLRCVTGDGRCLDCGAPGAEVRATPPTSAAPEKDPR